MGAVTPGLHLRWLPGARVEFPYRERTLGVALGVAGTVCHWAPERRPAGKRSGGHVAYEQNASRLEAPASVSIVPLCLMTGEAREEFGSSPDSGLWPEVGSRAVHRVLEGAEGEFPWLEVQPERERSLVAPKPFPVRIVIIAESRSAEIVWD